MFNVSTGMRNPFTIGDLADVNTKYFRERPLPDEDGLPVSVPDWRFSSASSILTKLDRATNVLETGPRPRRQAADPAQQRRRAPAAQEPAQARPAAAPERDLPPLRRARLRLRRPQRPRAAGLAASRRPRALRVRRRRRSTGTTTWRRSTSRRCARSPCRPRPARRRRSSAGRRPAPEGPPALALFDVEGVVLDSTVAHFYAWLRTRDMPELDKLVWTAGAATKVPELDHRGPPLAHRVQPQLLPPLQGPPGARAQAPGRGGAAGLHPAAHPARGRPPDPRAQAPRRPRDPDHGRAGLPRRAAASTSRTRLIAARLVERVGRFTGELAEPPLTADGRASPGRAPRRRPRRRPRRLPRLRRQPRRPAAARARRPSARDQPGLPALARGPPPPLADRELGRRRRAAV